MKRLAVLPYVLLVLLGVFFFTRGAHATTQFPPAIVTDLGVTCGTPQCTICHTSNSGGSGTATKPFAQAMKTRGLVKNDTTSLQTALTAMTTDKVDSNCNGIIDTDELIACTDPNINVQCDGGTTGSTSVVLYGCQTSPLASAAPTSAAAGIALLLLGGLVIARRRRTA